jgi:hypothetical protein
MADRRFRPSQLNSDLILTGCDLFRNFPNDFVGC